MVGRLLVMCPSRGRPERIKEMLSSYAELRSKFTRLVIVLDEDDPLLSRYDTHGYTTEIKPRQDVSKIYNRLVKDYPKFKYYCAINDDMIFKTKGWDETLIGEIEKNGGWGIAFGDDKIHSGRLQRPTNTLISGNIVKALGYLYPPELFALLGDVFLEDLGKALGRLYYRPDVVIEHKHYCANTAPNDDTYRFSESRHREEKEIYAKYKAERFTIDVAKVSRALEAELCVSVY